MEAYPNQWKFLSTIKRVSIQKLDKAFATLAESPMSEIASKDSKQLVLTIGSGIRLPKKFLDKATVNFLREELNFPNLDYWLKKRLGKSVYQTEKFFKLIEEEGEDIILPRGFLTTLTDHLRSRNSSFANK